MLSTIREGSMEDETEPPSMFSVSSLTMPTTLNDTGSVASRSEQPWSMVEVPLESPERPPELQPEPDSISEYKKK